MAAYCSAKVMHPQKLASAVRGAFFS